MQFFFRLGWLACLVAVGCAAPSRRTDTTFCGNSGELLIELARKHLSALTTAENAAELSYRPGEYGGECYVLVMRKGAPPGSHFYINFDKDLRVVSRDPGE